MLIQQLGIKAESYQKSLGKVSAWKIAKGSDVDEITCLWHFWFYPTRVHDLVFRCRFRFGWRGFLFKLHTALRAVRNVLLVFTPNPKECDIRAIEVGTGFHVVNISNETLRDEL